jgi:threonine/homoserine/homoserine lactone efflux protein
MPWLWVAAAVAWLSGLQSVLALVLRTPDQLLALERVFGVLFSGVAVAIYLVFVK